MNKIFHSVTAYLSFMAALMVSSALWAQPKFAQPEASELSILFINITGNDIEFAPLLTGSVRFTWNMLDTPISERNIIPSRNYANGDNLKIYSLTKSSTIFLMQDGQDIARIMFNVDSDGNRVGICLLPILETQIVKETDPLFRYKLTFSLGSNEPGASRSAEMTQWGYQCALWNQKQKAKSKLTIKVSRPGKDQVNE